MSVADPDPPVRGMGPDPALDLDPDPSIIKQKSVLRMDDILVWILIRIHGSMPLTYGSGFGSGPCTRILLFSLSTFKMPAKKQIL